MQTDAVYYFELHSNFQITKVFLKPHVIASSRTVIPTKVRSTAWRNLNNNAAVCNYDTPS